jgi:hypothetical protein
VQSKVESFGGDVCPRSHRGIDDNIDRYESNLCFKGLREVE